MPSTASIVGTATVVGALSYLVYFDYQRRNSPAFRRQLRRQATHHQKAQEKVAKETKSRKRNEIESLIEASLASDPLPTNIQAREQFFIGEVARADELLNAGPSSYAESALAFYRALMVYPSPADLLGVYDKSIRTPEVLEHLRTMVVVRPPPALAAAVQETFTPDLAVE